MDETQHSNDVGFWEAAAVVLALNVFAMATVFAIAYAVSPSRAVWIVAGFAVGLLYADGYMSGLLYAERRRTRHAKAALEAYRVSLAEMLAYLGALEELGEQPKINVSVLASRIRRGLTICGSGGEA